MFRILKMEVYFRMQENFVLKAKRAVKKISAISTGVIMLGATIGGAMALDLKDYPSPFVMNGQYDSSNLFVVGAKAAASDTLGVLDIGANLQFESKTCVKTGGSVSVSGGVTEDIPLGFPIADDNSTTLDKELSHTKIDSLLDTTVTFQSTDYDIKETLVSGQAPSTGGEQFVTVATSLTSSEDDYETGVFLEAVRDSLKYYYIFDDTISVNASTASNPLSIKFLGQTLKVTNVPNDDGSKFTAYVGAEYFMEVGDSVEVNGKKVTLENVGSSNAIVINVDGVSETISSGSTETVNGIEIVNDEVFYEDNKDQRSATLIIGTDASDTYKDGDAYVGEDKDDPNWVWNIGNLNTKSSTTTATTAEFTGPYIGVENDFVYDDASDNPPGVGDCIDLPNNYLSVCLESLTVPDDQYATYTIERDSSADLDDAGLQDNMTGVSAIFLHTPVNEGIALDVANYGDFNSSSSTDIKTDKVWIFQDNDTTIDIFYRDTNGKARYAGGILFAPTAATNGPFGHINYGSTKDTDINLYIEGDANSVSGGEDINVTFVPYESTDLSGRNDNITTQWRTGAVSIASLGTTASSEEAGEVKWTGLSTGLVNVGTKDEDHRTRYGIIIRDPKSHGSSDEVVLDIPADIVRGNVVVKGRSAVTSSGGETCTVAAISPKSMLDSDVTDATKYNVILVGGPCANMLVEKLNFGVTCDGWTLKEGEAIIKLANNGDKVAMLVAGTEALDTQRAAKVIANYKDYALETTEAIVTGTTLSDITVKTG